MPKRRASTRKIGLGRRSLRLRGGAGPMDFQTMLQLRQLKKGSGRRRKMHGAGLMDIPMAALSAPMALASACCIS